MAKFVGKDCKIEIGSTPVDIGPTQSFVLEITANLATSTVMGDAFVARTLTLKDWNAQIETVLDEADAGQVQLQPGDAITDAVFYTENAITGRTRWRATAALVESASRNVDVNGDTNALSIRVVGNGGTGIVSEAIP